jgi:hypothetical protein
MAERGRYTVENDLAEAAAAAAAPPPPPASAPKAEHVSYATDTLGLPAEEAEAMTKAELAAAAQQAAAQPGVKFPKAAASG